MANLWKTEDYCYVDRMQGDFTKFSCLFAFGIVASELNITWNVLGNREVVKIILSNTFLPLSGGYIHIVSVALFWRHKTGDTCPRVCLSTAKMSLDRHFVILSIPELNYLLLNLTALKNQLARYRMADPDFVEQAQNAAGTGRFMS